MSVARAQAEITSSEFAEWLGYHTLEPFGPEREDLRAAIISATVANTTAPRGQKFKPADFMPHWGPRRMTSEEMKAKLMGLKLHQDAQLKRRGGG